MKQQSDFEFQTTAQCLAGVDEVGRGPLAGPVVAAAVILDPDRPVDGLKDSKKLSERHREDLAGVIRERALAWSLGRAEVHEIDRINILQSALLAMAVAVEHLEPQADFLLIDGNHRTSLPLPQIAIVKGDARSASIAAASIVSLRSYRRP